MPLYLSVGAARSRLDILELTAAAWNKPVHHWLQWLVEGKFRSVTGGKQLD